MPLLRRYVDPFVLIRQTEGCDIAQGEHYLRGTVGEGLAIEVQECYRAFVNECLQRQSKCALVVGRARSDAFYHLALRDVLRSMTLVGLPPGFRLALVSETAELIAVYDAAMLEALRCGIEAKRFATEPEAAAWLAA